MGIYNSIRYVKDKSGEALVTAGLVGVLAATGCNAPEKIPEEPNSQQLVIEDPDNFGKTFTLKGNVKVTIHPDAVEYKWNDGPEKIRIYDHGKDGKFNTQLDRFESDHPEYQMTGFGGIDLLYRQKDKPLNLEFVEGGNQGTRFKPGQRKYEEARQAFEVITYDINNELAQDFYHGNIVSDREREWQTAEEREKQATDNLEIQRSLFKRYLKRHTKLRRRDFDYVPRNRVVIERR